jgi:hypothetical protein
MTHVPYFGSTPRTRQLLYKVIGPLLTHIDDLLGELQGLPLAIACAGSYMRETLTSPEEYVAELRRDQQRFSLFRATYHNRFRHQGVANSLLETRCSSIEYLRAHSPLSYMLLNTLAFLDNRNIYWELLQQAAEYNNKELRGKTPADRDVAIRKSVKRLVDFTFLAQCNSNGIAQTRSSETQAGIFYPSCSATYVSLISQPASCQTCGQRKVHYAYHARG